MEYRPLAEIKKEIQQNLDVIHRIDKDIGDNLGAYTISTILNKKLGYTEPHKIIKRLRQDIEDGLYEEAQNESLF